ncbi:hypothetical protein HYDPIDRAFT_31659 [Hydnomerulius pinastri MD-312]|uniref:Pet127-domain-containing protein n=1 Tax=Hydnomerulius pinastri MD-312 TaxID=994086 RepID=A0A0C9V6C3_9AGAM|nr:hypothetical protein HYDPIDRAFT_31659 [Hydnomerulius pinastri MD-312]
MKILQTSHGIARLALVVAGRRVTQRFHARLFHASLASRAEASPASASVPAPAPTIPPKPPKAAPKKPAAKKPPLKKKPKKPPPPPKSKLKLLPKPKPTPKKPKRKLPLVTHASLAHNTSIRDAVLKNLGDGAYADRHGQPSPELRAFVRGMTEKLAVKEKEVGIGSGNGFKGEEWSAGWGKDELAPPPLEDGAAGPSSLFERLKPTHPHPLAYTRRTEGSIRDPDEGVAGEECKSILQDIDSPSEHKPIARLAHGLDRVLFNQGVHWLQDPRSRVYNFPPWLESIPKVTDFAFEKIQGFVKSSSDTDLHTLAKRHNRPFTGSTSSLTGLLSHVYFLISGDRDVDMSPLSRAFTHEATNFTPGQRMPTSVVLNHKEGVWSIDADKADEIAEKNVLTWMGTMLEKFLTVPEGEFRTLLRTSPAPALEEDGESKDTRREAYRYAMSDCFVMRSQLDCVDSRLPGTGVFDIKTRAAVPIRLDVLNYEENSGYLIKTLTGPLESFEKEYYDLIRTRPFVTLPVFTPLFRLSRPSLPFPSLSSLIQTQPPPHSFQVRIGAMDGVLVAYHNTSRIFGFQYVSLEEMEARLYGSAGNGTRVFNKCLELLERVLGDVVGVYGQRSVRCTFETRERFNQLNVFIEPADWDEVAEGGAPCPITQLNVEVGCFVDGEKVKGGLGVGCGRPWHLEYTITQPTLSQTDIRTNLAASQSRQFRAMNFPAGIESVEAARARWESLDYGGTRREAEDGVSPAIGGGVEGGEAVGEARGTEQGPVSPPSTAYRPMEFRPPNEAIVRLRQLAREGRDESLRAEAEAEGREKVVWGAVDAFGGAEEGSEVLVEGCAESADEDGNRSITEDVDGVAVEFAESMLGDVGPPTPEDPLADVVDAEGVVLEDADVEDVCEAGVVWDHRPVKVATSASG